MNDIKWRERIPILLFTITLLAFVAFFLYMATQEHVSVYRAEPTHTYVTLTDLDMEQVEDDTAPAGIRKIYRGIIDPELSKESCLLLTLPTIISRSILTICWHTASSVPSPTASAKM